MAKSTTKKTEFFIVVDNMEKLGTIPSPSFRINLHIITKVFTIFNSFTIIILQCAKFWLGMFRINNNITTYKFYYF